ncbi:MAG: hypothetical protein ACREJY_12745 [Candidatus Rokuibacteriota bacterium]
MTAVSRAAGALFSRRGGTRFVIYTQWRRRARDHKPEIITLDVAPGRVKAGPSDASTRVIDARRKRPYTHEQAGRVVATPPYPRGRPRHPVVRPTPRGHFDHLKPGTRQFSAVSVFATVHCVLQIWRHYFRRPLLPWFFEAKRTRLELIPRVESANAWSGEGFLEFGYANWDSRIRFCDLFDVVAHETGHLILKKVIGNPTDGAKTLAYRAHEEAGADLIALVAALHFDSVVDRLLWRTRGALFSVNELSRLAEYGHKREVRELFNEERLASPRVRRAAEKYQSHGYSLPFSGAAYDVFVGLYIRNLRERGVLARAVSPRPGSPRHALAMAQRSFHRRFGTPRRFEASRAPLKDALLDARDVFARTMAHAWRNTSVDGFSYGRAVANILEADREVNGGRNQRMIRDLFAWRGITPGQPR